MMFWRNGNDPTRNQPVLKDPEDRPAYCLAWGANDKWLISGHSFEDVCLWDTSNVYNTSANSRMHTFYIDSGCHTHGVSCSPDGQYVAFGGADRGLQVWRIKKGASPEKVCIARNIHSYQIWDVEFSPDGKMIATTGADGVVRVWELEVLAKKKNITMTLMPKWTKTPKKILDYERTTGRTYHTRENRGNGRRRHDDEIEQGREDKNQDRAEYYQEAHDANQDRAARRQENGNREGEREGRSNNKGLSRHGKDRVRDQGNGWNLVEHGAGFYKEPFSPGGCEDVMF